jgi:hypothetical protein
MDDRKHHISALPLLPALALLNEEMNAREVFDERPIRDVPIHVWTGPGMEGDPRKPNRHERRAARAKQRKR